jgi:hypothetical protein
MDPAGTFFSAMMSESAGRSSTFHEWFLQA